VALPKLGCYCWWVQSWQQDDCLDVSIGIDLLPLSNYRVCQQSHQNCRQKNCCTTAVGKNLTHRRFSWIILLLVTNAWNCRCWVYLLLLADLHSLCTYSQSSVTICRPLSNVTKCLKTSTVTLACWSNSASSVLISAVGWRLPQWQTRLYYFYKVSHKWLSIPCALESILTAMSDGCCNGKRCCYIQKKCVPKFVNLIVFGEFFPYYLAEYEYTTRPTIRTKQNTNRIFSRGLINRNYIITSQDHSGKNEIC